MGKRRQDLLFEVAAVGNDFYEKRLAEQGVKYIAGVDEVGRGCLAGPVLAAAVVLPFPLAIKGITDSKKLSAKKREELFKAIADSAVAFSFGVVSSGEIDEINILQATLKAMRLAVESLRVKPGYLLVDGSHVVPVKIPQLVVPKGDLRSVSVGAASIIAKVRRDEMMVGFERLYSDFSFSLHKGYGTALHMNELGKHGPTEIHRRSFIR